MQAQNIHESLKPISWLCGRWVSMNGRGTYPNIPDFNYHDELEFKCIGQPMFNFTSKSTHPEKQTPMHQERGFLRIKPGTNELAFVVSHNFGLTSVEEGTCDLRNKTITLESQSVSRISFAKSPHVVALKREIRLLNPNTLEIILSMETNNTPMTQHLKAVYKKVELMG